MIQGRGAGMVMGGENGMDSNTAYEITDTCEAIVTWLLDYLGQNRIPISAKDGKTLDRHLSRLQALYEQAGCPLRVNPIKSRWVTGKNESLEGNSTRARALSSLCLGSNRVKNRLVGHFRICEPHSS